MAYSLQPVTHEQAVANKRSVEPFKLVFVTLSIVGIAIVATLLYLFDGVTATTARIFLVVGGGLAAVGLVGMQNAIKRMRYRITVSRFRVILSLAVSLGCVLLAAWCAGLDIDSSELNVIRVVLIVILLAQFATVLNQITLFDGDCIGLRFLYRGLQFRRTRVAWDQISQVVFSAGRKTGTIEVGVCVQPNATVKPLPSRASEVLTDLPYRIVVPEKNFDINGMRWLLNQSGRNDIALVERTPAGERVLGHANSWQ